MTVVNVKSEQEKQAEVKFPYIAKSKSNRIIVMFIGKGDTKSGKHALAGVVIKGPDEKRSFESPFGSLLGFFGGQEAIGHYSDTWNGGAFERYTDPVTLQDADEVQAKSENDDD